MGWNDFQGFRVPDPSGAYYDYRLGNSPKFYGWGAENYSTDVLAHRAVNFIWSTPRDKSLFLYFAPYAPHAPWLAGAARRGSAQGKAADLSTGLFRLRPSTTSPTICTVEPIRPAEAASTQRASGQGESLIAVDDAVSRHRRGTPAQRPAARHDDRLHVRQRLSDGDHRIIGKNVPYQEATSVPLVIRWDGRVRAGAVDNRLTGNIDIAATIADAAGTTMKTDGQSLLGDQRRTGLLLEAAYSEELNRPPYCGWRDDDWLFAHYATGEEELYSVPNDPEELHNLASDPAQAAVLASLRAKAKQACRPMPPDFHW